MLIFSLNLFFHLTLCFLYLFTLTTYSSLFMLTAIYIQYTTIFIHSSINMLHIHFPYYMTLNSISVCLIMHICKHSVGNISKNIVIFNHTRYSQITLIIEVCQFILPSAVWVSISSHPQWFLIFSDFWWIWNEFWKSSFLNFQLPNYQWSQIFFHMLIGHWGSNSITHSDQISCPFSN